DDEIGAERDCPRDAYARLLSAGQLMRKAVKQLERQADLAGKRLAARAHRRASLHVAQPQDRVGDGARGGEARIEAVGRILEHHLDALAQRELGERLGRNRADIFAIEHDDAVALVDEAHHHRGGRRLAAAGLSDQADALAAVEVKLMPSTARKVSGCGAGLRWKILAKPPSPLRGYSLTSFSTTSSGAVVLLASPLALARAVRSAGKLSSTLLQRRCAPSPIGRAVTPS